LDFRKRIPHQDPVRQDLSLQQSAALCAEVRRRSLPYRLTMPLRASIEIALSRARSEDVEPLVLYS
jgi:hypothetical protein